ncbi:MAG: hypothetical protein J0L69_01610 [Bacteroidetes bacterium]|nr:hypothetical protein [Bacteroidota bacterium]
MDIKNQIAKLIAKTQEGKVDWKALNASVFRWTINDVNGTIIINFQVTPQATPQGLQGFNQPNQTFIFTMQNLNSSEVIIQLQVNRSTNAEYLGLMQNLYLVIAQKTQKNTAQILDNLLDRL